MTCEMESNLHCLAWEPNICSVIRAGYSKILYSSYAHLSTLHGTLPVGYHRQTKYLTFFSRRLVSLSSQFQLCWFLFPKNLWFSFLIKLGQKIDYSLDAKLGCIDISLAATHNHPKICAAAAGIVQLVAFAASRGQPCLWSRHENRSSINSGRQKTIRRWYLILFYLLTRTRGSLYNNIPGIDLTFMFTIDYDSVSHSYPPIFLFWSEHCRCFLCSL